jgi:uncharacterized membrane protein YccC
MKQPLGEWGESEHEAKIEDQLDRVMRDTKQRIRDRLILNVLGVVIGAVAVFLIMRWFDWKLLVVIFLAMFGNNLSQK